MEAPPPGGGLSPLDSARRVWHSPVQASPMGLGAASPGGRAAQPQLRFLPRHSGPMTSPWVWVFPLVVFSGADIRLFTPQGESGIRPFRRVHMGLGAATLKDGAARPQWRFLPRGAGARLCTPNGESGEPPLRLVQWDLGLQHRKIVQSDLNEGSYPTSCR